jgi:hypothetical protein
VRLNSIHIAAPSLLKKVESLKARAELLIGLDVVVNNNSKSNLSRPQWKAINNQLHNESYKIRRQIEILSDKKYADVAAGNGINEFANQLGEIELRLTEAYSFYDTYMDILTQRLSPTLGPLLKGCDAIAADGLNHSYLTDVTRNPIVYCDRGFGASILREGVTLSKAVNPIAFIAIPYSRLAEKYNLISIYHEVGHQAINKLNLIDTFRAMYSQVAKNYGANQMIQNMVANWSLELIPDFWAFGHTGMAQTSSMRDVLIVPQTMAFDISPYKQHPPSYLRFLMSVEWCKYMWGRGDWDDWEEEWLSIYPIALEDSLTREVTKCSRRILPLLARATISANLKNLGRRPLLSIFNTDAISPEYLKNTMRNMNSINTKPIGTQLAVFRLLRDKSKMNITKINDVMHHWLIGLNNN